MAAKRPQRSTRQRPTAAPVQAAITPSMSTTAQGPRGPKAPRASGFRRHKASSREPGKANATAPTPLMSAPRGEEKTQRGDAQWPVNRSSARMGGLHRQHG